MFSHGRSGELLLEGQWLNARQIASWLFNKYPIFQLRNHQLNIYGCNFGKGEKGKTAISYLETALGVSIAASDDITGIDGDWELEIGYTDNPLSLKTYKYNLQGPIGDYDGDGILNGVDLDDDNDGILDSEETLCGLSDLTFGGIYANRDPVSNPGSIATLGSVTPTITVTPGIGGSLFLMRYLTSGITGSDFDGYILVMSDPNGTASNDIEINFGQTIANLCFTIGDIDSFVSYEEITVTAFSGINPVFFDNSNVTIINPGTLAYDGNATFTGTTSSNLNSDDGVFELCFDQDVDRVVLSYRIPNAPPGIDVLSISNISYCDLNEDTDNDGLPDYLDLDSDADTCPDAVEGGGIFTEYDLVSSGINGGSSSVVTNLGTTVDADGVPTNTGSPQATTVAVTDATDSNACKADLSLSKGVQQGGVDVGSVSTGSIITFIVTITNDGPHPVANVELTDTLPAGLTGVITATTTGTFNLGSGLWDLGPHILNVGDSEILRVTATVGTNCISLTNIAEITAMDREDIDSTPNNGH